MNTDNHKEAFYRLNHELTEYQWDAFKERVLEHNDRSIFSSEMFHCLRNLKYSYNHVTHGSHGWWERWLHNPVYQTLLDLHMITSSVTIDSNRDYNSVNHLTKFGRKYVDYALPKTNSDFMLDATERSAIKQQVYDDHNLTTDYAWRYEGSLIGFTTFLVLFIITSILYGGITWLLIAEHILHINKGLFPTLLFIGLILLTAVVVIGAITGCTITNSRTSDESNASWDYNEEIQTKTRERCYQYLKKHHGTKVDFIKFLSKNDRWKMCFQDPKHKIITDINHYMFV